MKTASRGSQRAGAGYTLVELLVALTLLGFIAVFLGGTFKFGARAWDTSAQEIDRVAQVEAVQTLLRRELSQVTDLSFVAAAGEPVPVFVGKADDLRFAAPLAIHHGDSGLYVLVLGRNGNTSRDDLVLRWQVYRPDASVRDEPTSEPIVLLREIEDIRFAYFGRLSDDVDPEWHGVWDDVAGLPDLIRVDVEFSEADLRFWPTLVVALKFSGGGQQ